MICHIFDTKPLSEPMLAYQQMDPEEQISLNVLIKAQKFSIKNVHLKILSVKLQPFFLILNVLSER